MSSNNISQKQILAYVVSTFQYYGIFYIEQAHLKAAKNDQSQEKYLKPLKKLLFHLIFLHMFDFQYTIQECFISNLTTSKDQIRQSEMNQIILAYLSQCDCPYLLQMKDEEQYVGCNFSSSRNILLLCAWVMGISDYFNKINQKVIEKRMDQIQNPIKKFPNNGSKNILHSNSLHNANKSEKQSDQIRKLYKIIKARQYNTECLQQKKQKLIFNMNKRLKSINPKLNVQDLINSKQSDSLILQKQSELKVILINEIQNMKQRKYFWIWLQDIIKIQKNSLKVSNQQLKQNTTYQYTTLDIDLDYLKKYHELCQYYNEKYQQLFQKLQNSKMVPKKSKQIQLQVNQQFKDMLLIEKDIKFNKKHLFLALQLKNHMNLQNNIKSLRKKQEENVKSQSSINKKISQKQSTQEIKLRQQLKKTLQKIQDFIKFI